MKIVFLDAITMGAGIDLSPLNAYGQTVIFPFTTPQQTRARISDADIVITNKVVLDRSLMEKAPRLKLICVAATGMNNIDLDFAAQRGIVVRNVKDYSTDSVTQLTFALLFYLIQHLSYYDTYVKEGRYAQSPVFTHLGIEFSHLAGKKFGIIGLGSIGRQVAKVAAAFGCQVVYHSASGNTLNPDYERLDLDTLLRTCDVVSIHAALTDQTKNLIDEPQLRLMQPHGILLNLGRGGIVNEQALAKALNEKWIAGAGLDVLEKEPIRANHPFLSIADPARLIITPHIGWASKQARHILLEGICKNIATWQAEKQSISPAD